MLSIRIEGSTKDANAFLAGALGLIWPGICANETPGESCRSSRLVKGTADVGSKAPIFPVKGSSKEVYT